MPADNYFDTILALNMDTGAINWANVVIPFDVWTVSCLFGLPDCPDPAGPDFDFGQAPMLMKVKIPEQNKHIDLVGAGQKSGIFWALNADDGSIRWTTRVSPGGVAGGLQWGSAFDGERIYTSSANVESRAWTLPDGSQTNAGIWSALNPATGEILWQTANPANFKAGGAASVANGIVFACSMDGEGHMYAMNAATGAVQWSFASGGTCNSGAAIVDGKVFWGSGYKAVGFDPADTSNWEFRAFALPE
ncbi:PQQ-binding-like beta-propeller repeat protein [Pseudobowmanella zhangzhouensis]|uniref:outer membrane protein assembly factor BamB family protein n=1 Tax=Pseudobowmanella zhangzhouensis TaxID=1537679 RepID=UPI00361B9C28